MSNSATVSAVEWEALAWPDIAATLDACGHTVLWPFGATEQHGPHLGCGVDSVIADAVCKAVSAWTRVPVLPCMTLGLSSGHSRRWSGTLSLSAQTLIAVVADTADWLVASGVKRIILVNAHVTNFAPLRCALEGIRARHDGVMVTLISTAEISARVRQEFFSDGNDWHANAAETALMMHLRPGMVVGDRVATADDPDRTLGLEFAHPVNATSSNGVTGYPSRATTEDGERLFSWMVDDLSLRVTAAMNEQPPLPFSYHSNK